MIFALASTTIYKWALVIIGIPVIFLLVRHVIVRARALSDRIDEYHAEQEAKKSQPGPINPYADFERLMGKDEPPEKPKTDE